MLTTLHPIVSPKRPLSHPELYMYSPYDVPEGETYAVTIPPSNLQHFPLVTELGN